jgi:DNA-binding MarR family transcriptional regulator
MPTPIAEDAAARRKTELGAELLSVVARLNRLANQRTRLPLPWAQARLLSTIEDQGQARISDLAYLDHCSQPTMTTQVRRLEDAGLVSRTADPGDARAVLIRITDEGRRTLTQARIDRAAAINPRLDRLTPEDRQTLAAAVDVIRRLLEDRDPSDHN